MVYEPNIELGIVARGTPTRVDINSGWGKTKTSCGQASLLSELVLCRNAIRLVNQDVMDVGVKYHLKDMSL